MGPPNLQTSTIDGYRRVLQHAVEVGYYRDGAEQLLKALRDADYLTIGLDKTLADFASAFVSAHPADETLSQIVRGNPTLSSSVVASSSAPIPTLTLWLRLQASLRQLEEQLSGSPKETEKDVTIRRLSQKVQLLLKDVEDVVTILQPASTTELERVGVFLFGSNLPSDYRELLTRYAEQMKNEMVKQLMPGISFEAFAKQTTPEQILSNLFSSEAAQGIRDEPTQKTLERLVCAGYLNAGYGPTEKMSGWKGLKKVVEIAEEEGVSRFFGLRVGQWIRWPRILETTNSPQPANDGEEFWHHYFVEMRSGGSLLGRILDLLRNGVTVEDQLEMIRAKSITPQEVAKYLLDKRDRTFLAIRWLSQESPATRMQVLQSFTVRGKPPPRNLQAVFRTALVTPLAENLEIDITKITEEELIRALEDYQTAEAPVAAIRSVPKHGRRLRSAVIERPLIRKPEREARVVLETEAPWSSVQEGHHRIARRAADGTIIIEPLESEAIYPRTYVDPMIPSVAASEMELQPFKIDPGMRAAAGVLAFLEPLKMGIEGWIVVSEHQRLLSTSPLGAEDATRHGLYYGNTMLFYLPCDREGARYQIPRVADLQNVVALVDTFLRDDPRVQSWTLAEKREFSSAFAQAARRGTPLPFAGLDWLWSSRAQTTRDWLKALEWRREDLLAVP